MLLNIEEKVLFNRGWYLGKIDQRANKKAHPFRSELFYLVEAAGIEPASANLTQQALHA